MPLARLPRRDARETTYRLGTHICCAVRCRALPNDLGLAYRNLCRKAQARGIGCEETRTEPKRATFDLHRCRRRCRPQSWRLRIQSRHAGDPARRDGPRTLRQDGLHHGARAQPHGGRAAAVLRRRRGRASAARLSRTATGRDRSPVRVREALGRPDREPAEMAREHTPHQPAAPDPRIRVGKLLEAAIRSRPPAYRYCRLSWRVAVGPAAARPQLRGLVTGRGLPLARCAPQQSSQSLAGRAGRDEPGRCARRGPRGDPVGSVQGISARRARGPIRLVDHAARPFSDARRSRRLAGTNLRPPRREGADGLSPRHSVGIDGAALRSLQAACDPAVLPRSLRAARPAGRSHRRARGAERRVNLDGRSGTRHERDLGMLQDGIEQYLVEPVLSAHRSYRAGRDKSRPSAP